MGAPLRLLVGPIRAPSISLTLPSLTSVRGFLRLLILPLASFGTRWRTGTAMRRAPPLGRFFPPSSCWAMNSSSVPTWALGWGQSRFEAGRKRTPRRTRLERTSKARCMAARWKLAPLWATRVRVTAETKGSSRACSWPSPLASSRALVRMLRRTPPT